MEESSPGCNGRVSWVVTLRRCDGPCSPSSGRAWPPTRSRSAFATSAGCAASTGGRSTGRSEPKAALAAGSPQRRCCCDGSSRSTTCSTIPACRGSRPNRRRWPPSRRLASSAGFCPNGATVERRGASGATSRFGCRSRWTPSVPCSACLTRHGDGWDVHGHPALPWGRSRPAIPCVKAIIEHCCARGATSVLRLGRPGSRAVGESFDRL